jgi:hypothetical protein
VIVAIHQPQFLPYLGFFHKVARCDAYVVLDDAQFMKGSHQNRNLIKTAQGAKWLTVPVLHELGQPISAVRINPTEAWRRKHWAAIQTNYGRAPFFRQLSGRLREILVDGVDETLLPLDMTLLQWALGLLGIGVPVRLASALGGGGEGTDRLVGICRAVGADAYLSGAGGRRYMELAAFDRAGIAVRFQEYAAVEYPQLFPQHGFIPNLSVVDALFNCGPGARELIA